MKPQEIKLSDGTREKNQTSTRCQMTRAPAATGVACGGEYSTNMDQIPPMLMIKTQSQ
jgi:hypothetical protein